MPRGKKQKSSIKASSIQVSRAEDKSLLEKIQPDLSSKQSYVNVVLGGLILIVVGILLFNYFNKQGNLGPSQQTGSESEVKQADVSKTDLPGKYTVKEGDTLFLIAQNYYNDGYKYPEIAKANNTVNENDIEVGQILEIPKIELVNADTKVSPTQAQEANQTLAENSIGGAENQTVWGEKITGGTYTVQSGDWLSKISGRAYGDIMQFQKIAEANNITNPDLIEPGTVLKIPR